MAECNNCYKQEEINFLRNKLEMQEKRIVELEKNHNLQEFQYRNIMEALKEMKLDILELKSTPKKRWDIAITGLITAVVTFLASKFLN